MYKFERKNYGCKLTFGGYIKPDEMQSWLNDSNSILKSQSRDFKLMVDLRKLSELPNESEVLMEKGYQMFRQRGMKRSVVILENTTKKMRYLKLAKDKGIDKFERYISSSDTPDWKKRAEKWLENGIEPDIN